MPRVGPVHPPTPRDPGPAKAVSKEPPTGESHEDLVSPYRSVPIARPTSLTWEEVAKLVLGHSLELQGPEGQVGEWRIFALAPRDPEGGGKRNLEHSTVARLFL